MESILYQTSTDWTYSLLWDEGDALSYRILKQVEELDHPKLRVYFGENLGVARARRFLTEHSEGEYILTIDDDDMMDPAAVERLLAYAHQSPWCGIVRARRKFIDEIGNPVDEDAWFPFETRHFHRGMVTDIHNHSQPNIFSRSAYDKTDGWDGFADFMFAGEDCDLYLKIEEVASVELLDEVLYYYRLHGKRTSHKLTAEGAFEMWRRLADGAIGRRGLSLRRTTDKPLFKYERIDRARPKLDDVDVVIAASADSSEANLDKTVESLRLCGVRDAAIHVSSSTDGLAAARNAGFRRTVRPIVLFVDSGGVFPSVDAIDHILAALEDQDADLASPTLRDKTGQALSYGGDFDGDRTPNLVCSEPRLSGSAHPPAWLPATVLAVRREVFLSVGGFDERHLQESLPDVDFCLKARSRDFKCAHAPAATAIPANFRSDYSSSLDVFLRKWTACPELIRSQTATA